ncbi:hypothetical protein AXF42_Ash008556 [Apostasia shenzhenica]|uniref:Uncharacterized protein n=1 Tax=Apostasia shenzhenica TaxID=1088818 RepID=A0A2I0B1Q6_9ASPA|nr:hypothetical protein AXF42_Ash008556 [Apostasia shenzhenica]
MNCSKKISSDGYLFVPCLSREEDYVFSVWGSRVSDLAPSCSFLSMTPTVELETNSEADLFTSLQKGFQLSWSLPRYTASKLIGQCLRESKIIGFDREIGVCPIDDMRLPRSQVLEQLGICRRSGEIPEDPAKSLTDEIRLHRHHRYHETLQRQTGKRRIRFCLQGRAPGWPLCCSQAARQKFQMQWR